MRARSYAWLQRRCRPMLLVSRDRVWGLGVIAANAARPLLSGNAGGSVSRRNATPSQEHTGGLQLQLRQQQPFNVYFEALCLNDEMFNTHGRFKEQVLDVVDFGRRSTLGADAKW